MSIEICIKELSGRCTNLKVNRRDTIREAKKKYGKDDHVQWKFGGIVLKDDKLISDYELEDGDCIYSNDRAQGGGGVFGLETIDVSKNNTKNIGFASSGKSYRLVEWGLSIQSKCKNNNCKAYEDTIYVQIGFVTNWDLLKNLKEVVCPACKKRVKPLNFGFYNCKYEIEYEKDENDEFKEGKVNGVSGAKDYIVFNEYSSGKATFTKLIFNITSNN